MWSTFRCHISVLHSMKPQAWWYPGERGSIQWCSRGEGQPREKFKGMRSWASLGWRSRMSHGFPTQSEGQRDQKKGRSKEIGCGPAKVKTRRMIYGLAQDCSSPVATLLIHAHKTSLGWLMGLGAVICSKYNNIDIVRLMFEPYFITYKVSWNTVLIYPVLTASSLVGTRFV